jgi:nitroreductase
MDLFEAIKNRRSVRAFTDEDVSKEEVEKLIDAARMAPSAGNIQPWKFAVVRKPEIKRKLAEAALNQTFIEEAPVVIVVCANEEESHIGYGKRGVTLYCIQDTAVATQNLLLAAYALGLGSCWVGAFEEEQTKKILNAPPNMRPVAMIPVGHPSKKSRAPQRKTLREIIQHETF